MPAQEQLYIYYQFYTSIRPDIDIWLCQSLQTEYK